LFQRKLLSLSGLPLRRGNDSVNSFAIG
jgi:hypothetical protein